MSLAFALAAAMGPAPVSWRLILRWEDGAVVVEEAEPSERAVPKESIPLRPGPGATVEVGRWSRWVPDPRTRWGGGVMVQEPIARSVVWTPPLDEGIRIGGRLQTIPEAAPRGGPSGATVHTLQDAGPPEERPDLTFLAEGYVAGREERFLEDVHRALDGMAAIDPWGRYLPLWNVHAVWFPSQEAGADHPEATPPVDVWTALDCTYDHAGIDRLISCDENSVLLLASAAPGDDVRVVLVDDPVYGGSGGASYAVAYNGTDFPLAVTHELGHTAALLADEYDYGLSSGGDEVSWPNCAARQDDLPWHGWIALGSPGVSAFLPCSYSDYYRPTYDACAMSALQERFCVVCKEQIVRTIHDRLPDLILGASPEEDLIELAWEEERTLEVDLMAPNGEPFVVRWVVDGEEQDGGAGLLRWTARGAALGSGGHDVEARVRDETAWVLPEPEPLPTSVRHWRIEVGEAPPEPEAGCASCGGSAAGLLGVMPWLALCRGPRPRSRG